MSEEDKPIELASGVLSYTDAAFADVVEMLKKLGHVHPDEVVIELDFEVRYEEPVRVTHYKAVKTSEL